MKDTLRASVWLVIALITIAGPGAISVDETRARGADGQDSTSTVYRSPTAVVVSPNGKTLYVTDRTAGRLVILDAAGKKKRGEIALRGKPQGAALSADGGTLYVAEHGAGSVAVIDSAKGEVASRISVGRWPAAVAVAHKTGRLYVSNRDNHTVSVIDLNQTPAKPIKQIEVIREPVCAAVAPDERHVVVANQLAHGVGTDPKLAAEVSIIDTAALAQSATVKLPPGSTIVQSVCVSPDGKWAYAVHGLGRFNLPITQLERGWVNTYALSVIDIGQGTRRATVLLDDLSQGAADPHSVVCSKDGRRLWISHTGVHEISMIDIGLVHELLDGKVPEDLAALKDGTRANIWVRIAQDPSHTAELENHLTALYIAGAIRRASSGGDGPRGIALSPDEKTLFVANYFSGTVAVLDAADGKLQGSISLGPQPEPDAVRRGEFIFHDAASHAFQRWHSCATCHANEGHVDGLRWDFLVDGIGNAKDTMPLVNLHKTEPMTRRGLFASSHERTRKGLESTNGLVPTKQDAEDLYAYLTSLRPVPSPHLTPEGKLTKAALRGKLLFEGKAACADCHVGPVFTDNEMYNVGTASGHYQEKDGLYDTPSLLEAYRTAPYLHDGRALTVKEVFTKHDKQGMHGETNALTEQELNDLVEYLLSL
ncbi:MAG: hypothetical protein CMJ64_15205 [Planctomycetaceae bacterium]|nr:hypothetical protein [Planctomycetaceae bacterium]